ncbi:LysE/ArgO family amino acid transporter [Salinicoccus halitifaciens]|uniref:L-lysine exporter family protein LysE/ArgO n=1 Tax=Salinicoccus halitifaciens TaxID=1073415 RepID=A0ABV2EBY3_9STAP|nr:LysE family transporter [Salinicoccus halitifaciens]MCD2138404.1 LysE family transporter [Salinicoccus halitifaciens]
MEAVLHGIILAFGLILPLGVQNVFIFSQGATQPNLVRALPATVTAALCDTLMILLAILGLSAIVMQFEWLRVGLMGAGVIFLIYMGFAIWRSEPPAAGTGAPLPACQQIIFALSVSLLNPHAIVDIVGVIGTNALKYIGTDLALFTTACIAVSVIWFFGLMLSGSIMKRLDGTGRLMRIFNKFSALFIWGTAIYLFAGLV